PAFSAFQAAPFERQHCPTRREPLPLLHVLHLPCRCAPHSRALPPPRHRPSVYRAKALHLPDRKAPLHSSVDRAIPFSAFENPPLLAVARLCRTAPSVAPDPWEMYRPSLLSKS